MRMELELELEFIMTVVLAIYSDVNWRDVVLVVRAMDRLATAVDAAILLNREINDAGVKHWHCNCL